MTFVKTTELEKLKENYKACMKLIHGKGAIFWSDGLKKEKSPQNIF